MGKPKFQRRKYDVPLHPWKAERIKSERELIKKYGLKNHREVWKAKTLLRKYRRQARILLGKVSGNDPQVKKESSQLLLHLTRMRVLADNCSLDDVLALDTESILSRRLQTLVYHRGFANTIKHARELVSHGHIAIGNEKMNIPGYLVQKDEENNISYTEKSPLNAMSHPARPKTEVQKLPPLPSVTPVVKEAPKVEQPIPPLAVVPPVVKEAPIIVAQPLPPKQEQPKIPAPKPVAVPEQKKEEPASKKKESEQQPKKENKEPSTEKPVKRKEPKKHKDEKKKEEGGK